MFTPVYTGGLAEKEMFGGLKRYPPPKREEYISIKNQWKL